MTQRGPASGGPQGSGPARVIASGLIVSALAGWNGLMSPAYGTRDWQTSVNAWPVEEAGTIDFESPAADAVARALGQSAPTSTRITDKSARGAQASQARAASPTTDTRRRSAKSGQARAQTPQDAAGAQTTTASEAAPTEPPPRLSTLLPIARGGVVASHDQASELANRYCRVVLDQAVQSRLDAEHQATLRMQKEIDDRISQLQAVISESSRWLEKRQEFQKKAQESIVKVYAAMQAEAAATRLTAVEEEVAAAIILKLTPKIASAVLGEMDPKKAARLTAYISGAADLTGERSRAGAPEKK